MSPVAGRQSPVPSGAWQMKNDRGEMTEDR
jgi:hypothetical protein